MRGVRGATTVDQNTTEAIILETEKLLLEIISQNSIKAEEVGSVLVSSSPGLNATFPARALRNIDGWKYVPVMCFQEIPVPSSMENCIRLMIHWNTDRKQSEINHVYLNNAIHLRPDLTEK
jgi:chorismate mutase